jgi:hypothetical protein
MTADELAIGDEILLRATIGGCEGELFLCQPFGRWLRAEEIVRREEPLTPLPQGERGFSRPTPLPQGERGFSRPAPLPRGEMGAAIGDRVRLELGGCEWIVVAIDDDMAWCKRPDKPFIRATQSLQNLILVAPRGGISPS